jgi:integrase
MPERGDSSQYALSDEQINALLSACESLEDKVMIRLMLYCGLRASEVTHLNADWLDGEGNIRIPSRQACDCNDCKGEWTPKTKASIRILPIPDALRGDLLFLLHKAPKGLQRSRITIWQRTKRLLRKAKVKFPGGLSDNTAFPHALRATCATLLAKGGVNSMGIAYYMGWKSIMVGEHYISLSMAKEAAMAGAKKIFG